MTQFIHRASAKLLSDSDWENRILSAVAKLKADKMPLPLAQKQLLQSSTHAYVIPC